jgi:hypothetical protein
MSLFAIQAFAQNSGSIQGTVTDAQGAVIPGATVEAIDQTKGAVTRQVTTSADGLFILQALQPSTYTIRVQAKGMKGLERKDLVLDNRQVLGLGELKLQVGATTENVTVEAVTPLVETATSDRSLVIDQRQVTEISMNGRDFQSLVRTLPGVLSNDTSDFRLAFNNTDSFHVNGLRGSDNNFFLDGAVNTDVGANDGQFTQLSMDAVGEFKLQNSNFAAEYGRNPGVLMAVNTKSGGQRYHGTLYEFNRQNGFDANNYFNKFDQFGNPLATPQKLSALHFNQFGGNIGGPIPLPHAKDKLFFFFNYEGTRAIKPNGGQSYNMPDPAWLTGDFSSALKSTFPCVGSLCSPYPTGTVFQPGTITQWDPSAQIVLAGTPYPGNVVPSSQFSQQYQGFNNFLTPLYKPGFFFPNAQDHSYVQVPFQDTYTFRKDQKVVRVDFNINQKTNFFFRWVDDSQKEAQGAGIFSWGNLPGLPEYRKKPGSSWSWNLANVITPTLTNEFIFSYNHLTQVVDVNTPQSKYDRNALGFTFQDIFNSADIRNLIPRFQADGNIQTFPFPPGWTSSARMFTWTDNLTKVSGPHTMKFGVFFDYNQAGQQPYWTETPEFNFSNGNNPNFPMNTTNGVANMLLGNYQTVNQSNGVFFGAFRFHQLELFGQDSWKVNKKLTLDYGLRWAYIGPTYTVVPFFENYFDPTRYDPTQAVTIVQTPTQFANGQPVAQNGSICTAANSLTTNSQAPECQGLANYGNPYNGMVQEGKGIPPGFVDHKYGNFMPRLGFAYDPTGSGKTAIRGGFGMFYERIRQNVNSFDGLGNPPLSYTPTFYSGNIDNISPALAAGGGLSPVSVKTPDKAGQIPVTYSWSLGVQRELSWKLGLDVAYVGNRGRHLQYVADLNQLPLGFTLDPNNQATFSSTWNAAVPYRGYTNIFQTKFGGNSTYNALQAKLTRRFSRGLTLSADYTYSKNYDLSDSDDYIPSVRLTTDPWKDWGPTGWDRPHVFNVNYVYELPDFHATGALKHLIGGWEVTGITRFWSGTPFSVYCGGSNGTNSNPGSGFGALCDTAGSGSVYIRHGLQWINPAAFTEPALGTLGNTTRNEFRGPGYSNWNISIFKNFTFTESLRLQLRLETFNTFNHTQYGGVGSTSAASNGGVNNSFSGYPLGPGTPWDSTQGGNSGYRNSTRDPRQIQLGIKLYF